MNEIEIDFVVPWVDGSDSDWLKEKALYDQSVVDDGDINSIQRYRDWNLMKYWFRSIEKFAPWFHKIHFLTWGHIPSFLKENHPKLNIVNHKDFIPLDCLPTYNASAIEMNLHKIPCLQEHFVYFNDDTFIINFVEKEDFFRNGLPRAYVEELPCIIYGKNNYARQLYNALQIINKNFKKHKQIKKYPLKWFSRPLFSRPFFYTLLSFPWERYIGTNPPHMPSAFLKSTWQEVWDKEYGILNDTLHSKFRGPENVQQELFRFWQIASGKFEPQKMIGEYFFITDTNIDDICFTIKKQKFKELCVNDGDVKNFEKAKDKLAEAFEFILPEKSSFEK